MVTNAHVVAGQDDTEVEVDGGSRLSAQAVAFDPRNDVAVLRVAGLAGSGAEPGSERPGRSCGRRSSDIPRTAPTGRARSSRPDADRGQPGRLRQRPRAAPHDRAARQDSPGKLGRARGRRPRPRGRHRVRRLALGAEGRFRGAAGNRCLRAWRARARPLTRDPASAEVAATASGGRWPPGRFAAGARQPPEPRSRSRTAARPATVSLRPTGPPSSAVAHQPWCGHQPEAGHQLQRPQGREQDRQQRQGDHRRRRHDITEHRPVDVVVAPDPGARHHPCPQRDRPARTGHASCPGRALQALAQGAARSAPAAPPGAASCRRRPDSRGARASVPAAIAPTSNQNHHCAARPMRPVSLLGRRDSVGHVAYVGRAPASRESGGAPHL